MSRQRKILATATVMVGILLAATAAAVPTTADLHGEYEVKAAFLYSFGLFVEWEKDSAPARDGVVTLCVFGQDPFGELLDRTLAGKRIGQRPVVLRRIARPEDGKPCAILFVGVGEAAREREVVAAVSRTPVLTVGEDEEFLPNGGIVRFFRQGAKIRFEINREAAETAGLKISSKLLNLAKTARPAGAAGPPS